MFRVEGLTCKVISYASNQHQSLHLKLEPDQAYAHHWNSEMIGILERFFDSRVAIPPFRNQAIQAFCKILQSPIEALKDLIGIIRYDMMPETVAQNNLKWSIRICLTVPPAAPNLIPIGQPGLLRIREKMLMFFHLTHTGMPPPNGEPLSVVLPIVYDIENNQTSIPPKEMNPVSQRAQLIVNNLGQSGTLNNQRCTIMQCVRELLLNLTYPNEGPPMMPPHPMARPQMGPGPHMGPGMGGPVPVGHPGHMGPQQMRMMSPMMQQQQRMMVQQQQQQQHGYMG